MRKAFCFLALSVLVGFASKAQQSPINLDPNQSYINVNLPKTPESQGMEQFGKIPVNELTGTPNISIPLYTLQSNFLSVPITLSYHPTGIKVNQEASWVGLGWDIDAGGRITVETKGDVDKWPTLGFTSPSPSTRASGISALFARLQNSGSTGIMTFATPCPLCFPISGCSTCYPPLNVPDDLPTVQDMVQLGAGEPDIFNANFMGHSFKFYFDKVTGNLTFKGEQSTFRISATLNSSGYIGSFVITDNDGVIYYFNLTEQTTISTPSNATQIPTTTSAWLLTKIVHPSGDYVQFNYSNYGNSYPMMNLAASMEVQIVSGQGSGVTPISQTSNGGQPQQIQSPYYLSSIQSSDVEVDFSLGPRTDIYGSGSQRLNAMTIKERQASTLWKTINFNYSYFTATVNSCLSSLATYMSVAIPSSSYLACDNLRLRLDSLTINNLPPYKFTYNTTTVDKLSFAQDDFGYYNGAANNPCTPLSLIPRTGLGSSINVPAMDGSGNRTNNATAMQAMMLTGVTYPTGGNTVFTFEPHSANGLNGSPTGGGGGLRIKSISNYISGNLINSVNYSYSSGIYFGIVQYESVFYKIGNGGAYCVPASDAVQYNLSSNAIYNDNDLMIAYSSVTISETGSAGQNNGKIVKTFNVSSPIGGTEGIGITLKPAAWPINPPNDVNTTYLNDRLSSFPPTPICNLDGKLMQEQYFDNSNNPIKTINYYYHQANYSQNFYDIKTIDNVMGGVNNTCAYFQNNGNRAVVIFVSPNKTFTTLTDSIIETNYFNANPLIIKKYMTYNAKYQLQSETTINSDQSQLKTEYTYPYDYITTGFNGNTTLIYAMTGQNILNPVFTKKVSRNGTQLEYIVNNYFNSSGNIFVPQNTQVQIGTNPIETRYLYNFYDNQGHLLERQKPNGVKEDFLWGYNQRFPVAKVVGSSNSTVIAAVSSTVLTNPSSDAALRTELNKLRTLAGTPSPEVMSFTYNVFDGVTSQSDLAGRTAYFNYDPYGRLSFVQDQDLNIVKRYAYNYAGAPDGSTNLLSAQVNSSVTTNVPWNASLYSIATGVTSNYALYPGTSTTVLGNLALGYYNITLTPQYTLSSQAQLTFNGSTYTGTSFYLGNANLISAASIVLQPYSNGPCSFTMASGYSSPTNGLTNNSGTISGYLTFYSSSSIVANTSYTIATINGGCVPTGPRTFSITAGGNTFFVSINTSGQVSIILTSGASSIAANTTINFSSFSYTK